MKKINFLTAFSITIVMVFISCDYFKSNNESNLVKQDSGNYQMVLHNSDVFEIDSRTGQVWSIEKDTLGFYKTEIHKKNEIIVTTCDTNGNIFRDSAAEKTLRSKIYRSKYKY